MPQHFKAFSLYINNQDLGVLPQKTSCPGPDFPIRNSSFKRLEDALEFLPCSAIVDYGKGTSIYQENESSSRLFLIVDGVVKIVRSVPGGPQVLMDIYQRDHFFGESCFVDGGRRMESAFALEDSRLMVWSAADIEVIIMRRPKLGLALLQMAAQRATDSGERIETLSAEKIERRVARMLIRFSDRLGESSADGSVRIIPLTHELLAQYVGTSREIVTHHMSHFRRQGLLEYSRKGITLRGRSLHGWLVSNSAPVGGGAEKASLRSASGA